MSNSLPRTVAWWLQNLDLTYSVRNPNRDFSNGFLVAEILQRYFGSEVPLYSINPGTCLNVKRDNWNQLSHILIRKNIDIHQDVISDCINQRNGAGVSIVSQLFRLLVEPTSPTRTYPIASSVEESKAQSTPPHYTKLTAAFKVKDSNIERTVDDMERKLKRVQVICDLKAESRARPAIEITKLIQPEPYSIPLDKIEIIAPMIPTVVHSIEALLAVT